MNILPNKFSVDGLSIGAAIGIGIIVVGFIIAVVMTMIIMDIPRS